MPRSFEVSAESRATVEQILSAFADEEYWRARLATFSDGTATLTELTVDAVGDVTAVVTLSLLRDRLPKLVTQLYRGDLEMVRDERWTRISDSRVRGEVGVAVPGAPVSVRGEALLAPAPNGSRLNYTAAVEVRVPLVGGKIEDFFGRQFVEGIPAIQRFTTEWIAENG